MLLEIELSDVMIRALTADDYDDLLALWRDAGLPYLPNGRDSRGSIKNRMEHDPENRENRRSPLRSFSYACISC